MAKVIPLKWEKLENTILLELPPHASSIGADWGWVRSVLNLISWGGEDVGKVRGKGEVKKGLF